MGDICQRIDQLLREKGISGARMCADLGMSRSFMTELRKGRAKGVQLETAQKIAAYFGVTTDWLLGEEAVPVRRQITKEELKFALFGGREDITDEMYQEVLRFAQYISHRPKP